MNTRSASDGIVWITPAAVRMTGPSRGRRAATTPSGIATTIAAASEIATSARCSPSRRSRRRAATSRRRPAPRCRTAFARKSAATRSSGTRSILARAFIPAISPARDPPFQPRERRERRGRSRRQVGPIEPHAFVRGEEAEVVVEHAELVLLDLGVGRVEVGGLDLAARQGAIGQVVVEPADVALGEPVAVAQAGPAVGPIHELVAEPEFQLGMTAAGRTACGCPAARRASSRMPIA